MSLVPRSGRAVASARVLLLLVAAAALHAVPALADPPAAWPVKGKLLGAEGRDEKARDISGLACAPAEDGRRTCLIIDDEAQGAQILILEDGGGRAGDSIRLIDDRFDGKALELDAEAVAYSGGAFYVVGSHGRPRHEKPDEALKADARARAARHVFCIALDPGSVSSRTGKLNDRPVIRDSVRLHDVIRSMDALAGSADARLGDKGLTIEGAAVRDGRLFAGLRAPVSSDGAAYIVSVPLAVLFGETQPGQPDCGVSRSGAGGPELHAVSLSTDRAGRQRGIRDLVGCGSGFLILAGPERDPPRGRTERGDYAVYGTDFSGTWKLADLDAYGKKAKPEGLLPLKLEDGRLDALLLFDGPKEGRPTPVTIELGAFAPLAADGSCS